MLSTYHHLCPNNHSSLHRSLTQLSLLGPFSSLCRIPDLRCQPLRCQPLRCRPLPRRRPRLLRHFTTRGPRLRFSAVMTFGERRTTGPSASPVVSLDTSLATAAVAHLLSSPPWPHLTPRRHAHHLGTPLIIDHPSPIVDHHLLDDALCHPCVVAQRQRRETDCCSSGGKSCMQVELPKASMCFAAKCYRRRC